MQRKPLHKLLLHKCKQLHQNKLLKVQPRLQQILKPKQLPHKRVQPLTQRKLQFKP
jgi:hypothetical protein